MNILAIDTSTKILAMAVIKNGVAVATYNYKGQMRHAKKLFVGLENVMNQAKMSMKSIDQIACGVGPGSYTGLRIGHSFVKGLAVSRDIPVIPFSSLEVIAYNIKDTHKMIAVLQNARRGKFNCALFKRSKQGLRRLCNDRVVTIDAVNELLAEQSEIAVTGDALEKFSDRIEPALKSKAYAYSSRYWYVHAEKIAAFLLSRKKHATINSAKLIPNYLLMTEAEEKFGRVM